MKILHLCGGTLNSGATQGATALHKALLKQGIDSELIFSKGAKSEDIPMAEPFFEAKTRPKAVQHQHKVDRASPVKTRDHRKKATVYPLA